MSFCGLGRGAVMRARVGDIHRPCASTLFALLILLELIADANATAKSCGTFSPKQCARCSGLRYCTAMNEKLLFDPIVGYTREATAQLEKQGVCEDLDARTLALSQFGTQLQFKDSAECHTLVWNFHCLSWVATTFLRAINGVKVSCTDITTASSATAEMPLPPCRSLCVEVADKCVYSHFYRAYLENVCGNIACVSEEEEESTANSSAPLVEPECVAGAWITAPNTTFSRCSIREYVAPKSAAAQTLASFAAVVMSFSASMVLV